MNIQDAITLFLQSVKSELSANTHRTYANGIKVFNRCLLEKGIKPEDDVSKLEPDLFIHLPIWMMDRDFKKKTTGVYLVAAKRLLEYLVVSGTINMTHQQAIRLELAYKAFGRRRSEHLVRTPDKDDAQKMLDAVRQLSVTDHPYPELERARNIALIEILASSGCRNDEIRSLLVKHINLKEMNAIVTGKGDKERYVWFSPATAEALKFYWGLRGFAGQKDPAFCRHDKASELKGVSKRMEITTATIRNVVHDCAQLAGIAQFTPHYFRHAFAIRVLHETGNLALVQDLLGHADPASTRVYAKISPEDLRDAHREIFK